MERKNDLRIQESIPVAGGRYSLIEVVKLFKKFNDVTTVTCFILT